MTDVRDLNPAKESPLEEDRARLTGLHFAQDAMRPHERETLHLAEAMLRRINAALALHRRLDEPTHGSDDEALYECEECALTHPCPTVRALEGEL